MPRRPRKRIERGLYLDGKTYWACVTPKGQRTAEWERLGEVGIQEARRLRDDFAHQINRGAKRQPARLKVEAAEEMWLENLSLLVRTSQLRQRTLDSYESGVRLHFTPSFAHRPIASITANDLSDWHDQQRCSGAAEWSIRARWMGVRSLLSWAAREGHTSSNPCDLLTRRETPKPGKARDRYLAMAEIQALMTRASGDAAVIAPLLVFSGLRASEALGLVWDEIDFTERVITVRFQMSRQGQRVPVKTHRGHRDVVLMDQLAHILRRRRLAARFSSNADLVLGNGVNRTLGYSRFRKAFAEAAGTASLVGVTPHTCRHTFASILIDHGATVEFVSDQLGHATTKTTWDTYIHLFRRREHADNARSQLDAAFGPMLRAVNDDRDES